MTVRTWLTLDGRRLPMSDHGAFSSLIVIDGYSAGLFIMGSIRPFGDSAVRLELVEADDRCDVVWTSGARTSLGSAMLFAFVKRGLRGGVPLHWRDDQDQTVQRAVLPLSV